MSLVSNVSLRISKTSSAAHCSVQHLNTLRRRQNGCHFLDDIFIFIFLNKNVWILVKISLKFVPKGPINYIPALIEIMAWCRPSDKPLSEPMLVSLLMHICVTRPQWINHSAMTHPSKRDWHQLNGITHWTQQQVDSEQEPFSIGLLTPGTGI